MKYKLEDILAFSTPIVEACAYCIFVSVFICNISSSWILNTFLIITGVVIVVCCILLTLLEVNKRIINVKIQESYKLQEAYEEQLHLIDFLFEATK